jgi:hypothetical protein
MKAYLLKKGRHYNISDASAWKEYKGNVVTCVRKYATKRTIMLTWTTSNVERSLTIRAFEDVERAMRAVMKHL